MSDLLRVRCSLAPRNRIQATSRSIAVLLCLLGRQNHTFPARPRLNTDSFPVDETGMCAAVLVDQIQRIAREIVGLTPGSSFDEVGILVSCGRSASTRRVNRRLTGYLPDQV